MKFYIHLIVICFLVFSCGGSEQPEWKDYSQYDLIDEQCILPTDMYDLVRIENVAQLFNRDASGIELVPNLVDKDNLKGFFIWNETGENNGVYVSLKKNIYKEEGPDFIAQMVQNTKTNGEVDAEGVKFIYENMEGPWTDGAHSYESHTYVWQVNNCVLFKIVINTDLSAKEEYNVGYQLAVSITDNYYTYLINQGKI